MLTLGIDDAGRGPLIGPMILAGVLADEEMEKLLKAEKIRDSKTVPQSERVRLAEFIKNNSIAFEVEITSPNEIDSSIAKGVNLNTLEAIKCASIINKISEKIKKKIKVVVDCPSVNLVAWANTLTSFVKDKKNITLVCEHKADANHVTVSAASIIAKCVREEEVAKIKKKFGETGSGYPSDPYTKIFLEKHGYEFRDSGIFRKSWATWKDIFPKDAVIASTTKKKGQKSIGDF